MQPNPINDIESTDYQASVFVCGFRRVEMANGEKKTVVHPNGWNTQFRDHPWVQEANAEGWARQLRSHIVRVVAERMRNRREHHDIDQLMPPGELRAYWRKQAQRYADAAAFQTAMEQRFGSYDAFLSRGRPQGKTTWQSLGRIGGKL